MASLREKINEIISREREVQKEISSGKASLAEMEVLEEEIWKVINAEQEEISKALQILKESIEWERDAEKTIQENFPRIKKILKLVSRAADDVNVQKERILQLIDALAESMLELGEKPPDREELPEDLEELLEILEEIDETYNAVSELDELAENIDSAGELKQKQRRQLEKIEQLSKGLEEVQELEQTRLEEKDFSQTHSELEEIIEKLGLLKERSFYEEEEYEAAKGTMEQFKSLVETISQVEENRGLKRRDFLILAAGAAGAAVTLKYSYESMQKFSDKMKQTIEESEREIMEQKSFEDLSRAGKFIERYRDEFTSLEDGVNFSNHVVVGENHKISDGLRGLIDVIQIQDPGAIGLEFFYKEDEKLMRFNKGEASVKEVLNHWIQTEEDIGILGRGRNNKAAEKFLETARRENVDLYGLEPKKRLYYENGDPEYLGREGYLKRSQGMSEIAAELASKYSKTAYFVGYFHASRKAAIPYLLPRAAHPRLKGKFTLEEFMENPYLLFLEGGVPENSGKDYRDFHRHPETRFKYFLENQGYETSTVLATSAEEQLNHLQKALTNLPEDTRNRETFQKVRQATVKALETVQSHQPIKGSSKTQLNYLMDERFSID